MSARTPLAAIQKAVVARLHGGLDGVGVYDYVPEGADFPYVVVGESTESPDNWHGGFGRETTLTLHLWSQQRSFGEVIELADDVTELLDHQDLDLDAPHHTVAVRYEFSQTLRDPDDTSLRHCPIRFRIVTEQID